MNVLDLFSGIGGFSLGLEAAGMRTIGFCEIDPFCREVLQKHWTETPIHPNIKTFDARYLADRIDVICGGYPCQPFSTAGQRAGHEDERHLWPEMLRIIRSIRKEQPKKRLWVIAENVSGHLSLGFDEVAASLEAEGFTIWTFIVPACAVGARHRRDRIWIVAYAPGAGKRRGPGNIHKKNGGQNGKLSQQFNGTTESSDPYTNENCQPVFAKHEEMEIKSPEYVANSQCNGVQGGQAEAAEGLHESRNKQLSRFLFPCPWPEISESNVYGTTDGVPNRIHRNKALGNSVVPQIPYLIGKAILEYEKGLVA